MLALRKGDVEAAARWAQNFADPRDRKGWMAVVEYSAGRTAHARETRDAVLAKLGNKDPYAAARLNAWFGDRDAAFTFLEQSYARHVPWLRGLKFDTALEGLHSDPRWAALLKKMNLPLD